MPAEISAEIPAIDMWAFEHRARRQGFTMVAGLDEAGRGPLAGPVVSAAVILPPDFAVPGIRDSKKLSPGKRSRLFEDIYRHALSVGVGEVSPMEIDRINILQAALLSMAHAVGDLPESPDFLLIDGIFTLPAKYPQKAIPKGDALSISIAAASIVAKVTRDRLMVRYGEKYPEFGFSQHKGYPTKAHREAIQKHGVSPIHRRSFKGVKEYC